jgi:hypothetical protein
MSSKYGAGGRLLDAAPSNEWNSALISSRKDHAECSCDVDGRDAILFDTATSFFLREKERFFTLKCVRDLARVREDSGVVEASSIANTF